MIALQHPTVTRDRSSGPTHADATGDRGFRRRELGRFLSAWSVRDTLVGRYEGPDARPPIERAVDHGLSAHTSERVETG